MGVMLEFCWAVDTVFSSCDSQSITISFSRLELAAIEAAARRLETGSGDGAAAPDAADAIGPEPAVD